MLGVSVQIFVLVRRLCDGGFLIDLEARGFYSRRRGVEWDLYLDYFEEYLSQFWERIKVGRLYIGWGQTFRSGYGRGRGMWLLCISGFSQLFFSMFEYWIQWWWFQIEFFERIILFGYFSNFVIQVGGSQVIFSKFRRYVGSVDRFVMFMDQVYRLWGNDWSNDFVKEL